MKDYQMPSAYEEVPNETVPSGPIPLRSSELVGRCVEVGDDNEGQPRLIIHTTREQLMRFGRNLAFADVAVTIAPPNKDSAT